MDALALVAKLVGTGVIFGLAAVIVYMLMGGLGGRDEVARFGRVLSTDETWRRLGMSPARGCGLVFVAAALVTFLVVQVWLRWF